jgi:Txe/YoeB family toxin of Txe-Axe toxin-antitoxin module
MMFALPVARNEKNKQEKKQERRKKIAALVIEISRECLNIYHKDSPLPRQAQDTQLTLKRSWLVMQRRAVFCSHGKLVGPSLLCTHRHPKTTNASLF